MTVHFKSFLPLWSLNIWGCGRGRGVPGHVPPGRCCSQQSRVIIQCLRIIRNLPGQQIIEFAVTGFLELLTGKTDDRILALDGRSSRKCRYHRSPSSMVQRCISDSHHQDKAQKESLFDTNPACIPGVSASPPNFTELCRRTKL